MIIYLAFCSANNWQNWQCTENIWQCTTVYDYTWNWIAWRKDLKLLAWFTFVFMFCHKLHQDSEINIKQCEINSDITVCMITNLFTIKIKKLFHKDIAILMSTRKRSYREDKNSWHLCWTTCTGRRHKQEIWQTNIQCHITWLQY